VKSRPRVGECHYCNRIRELTRDHVVPKSKGGPNRQWNYVPCCSPCNQRKAEQEWREHCDDCTRTWYYFDHVFAPRPMERG
jgi:5-methylcytosine-specific restriction endonuclease McrA